MKHPAAHPPFIFLFPTCPCTVHPATSGPICLEARMQLWVEFLEVSATPVPYRDCPSPLPWLPFLSVQSAAREGQGNREKGSVVQRAFGLGHSVPAGITARTPSSPQGPSSGSVLNHRQAGARLPWPSQFALKYLHLNSL